MSKKQDVPEGAKVVELDVADILNFAPKDWLSYGERFLYKPDLCLVKNAEGKMVPAPLVGYPIEQLQFENNFGDFSMVTISLTRPTVALNRKRELVRCERGASVVVTQTYALNILERLARHQTHSFEVFMLPREKADIGGGQTMWIWDVQVNPKPIPRVRLDSGALPGDAPLPAQLAS